MKLFKDMDENQFWLTVWSLASTVVIIVAMIIADASNKEDEIIKQLIKQGYNPISLSCVYASGDTNQLACLVLAQAKAAKINEKKK